MASTLIHDIPPRDEWPEWVERLARVAWGAGLLDGEGYFQTVDKTGCAISVDSVHPQSIYELGRVFGGNPNGEYPSDKRNRFRWYIGGPAARELAQKLVDLDLLWNKKVEAEAVALSRKYHARTGQGKLLRERALQNRWAEYPFKNRK